jgi:hypothetical protein
MADDNRIPDDQLIPDTHHDAMRRDRQRIVAGQGNANPPKRRLLVEGHPHHKHHDEVRPRGPQPGPDGRLRYHHMQSNHEMPAELQVKLVEAHEEISHIHYKERTTSIPGNPYGGFPGLPDMRRVKDDLRRVRQAVIDDWHDENPDHEVE